VVQALVLVQAVGHASRGSQQLELSASLVLELAPEPLPRQVGLVRQELAVGTSPQTNALAVQLEQQRAARAEELQMVLLEVESVKEQYQRVNGGAAQDQAAVPRLDVTG
jgi:Skp family chaperone for outer membrane proteins